MLLLRGHVFADCVRFYVFSGITRNVARKGRAKKCGVFEDTTSTAYASRAATSGTPRVPTQRLCKRLHRSSPQDRISYACKGFLLHSLFFSPWCVVGGPCRVCAAPRSLGRVNFCAKIRDCVTDVAHSLAGSCLQTGS